MLVSWKETTTSQLMMISLLITLGLSLVVFFLSVIMAGEDRTACWVIAAVNQFLFLATFTWTNSLAIDVTYTIFSFVSNSMSKARFVAYFFYSFGFPLLLTLITFLLHEVQEDLELSRTVYRENYLCFLNDGTIIYWLFLAPICVLVFVNIVLCIVCMVRVTRKLEIASNDRDRAKKNAITCIKLSVCLGLGWILLYVSLVVEEFWPVVLKFIELQGVLVVTANIIGWDCVKKITTLAQSTFASATRTENTGQSTGSEPARTPPAVQEHKL